MTLPSNFSDALQALRHFAQSATFVDADIKLRNAQSTLKNLLYLIEDDPRILEAAQGVSEAFAALRDGTQQIGSNTDAVRALAATAIDRLGDALIDARSNATARALGL